MATRAKLRADEDEWENETQVALIMALDCVCER